VRASAGSRLLGLLLTTLLVLAGLGVAAPQAHAKRPTPPTGAAGPRAMWVWTQPSAKTLVSFARQHGVMDLHLSVPPALPTSSALTWVRSVSKAAAGTGIRLHALGGDPGWVDEPAAALAWQRDALSTGLFTGAHIDLEPWGHPQWNTERDRVVAGYLSTLDALARATDRPVEADIAFWLHTVPTADGTPLDAAVLQRVDRVTVMSYRNTVTGPDSIIDVATTALATAAADCLGPRPVTECP
jgi:hypothetical protein